MATDIFKSLAIPANLGKCISIENVPSAVREPKIRINFIYFIFVIDTLVFNLRF